MSSKTIATILTLQDKFSPKLVGVSAKVKGMSKEMQRASQQSVNMANKFGKGMMNMGDKIVKTTAKFVALGAIAAAGIVFKVGIDGLKELDEAAAKVKSIAMDNLDKKNIKIGLLKSSSKTGISTAELGDTQYNAISAGVSAKDSLAAALTSAKLARAGFTDANSALKVLASTMNVYGLKGDAAMQKISDKMLVVQNLGVTTVAELAESMGSVTPIAKATGASIDELDAGMIALTKNGIKTDEATVQLKGMFTSIIKPSKDAAKMAAKLGIDFTAAGLKSKGFAKFMAEVKEKTGGSTANMAKLFGNVRALTGALVLSGSGFDDFQAGLVALQKSSGMTDKAFEIMQNSIGNKWAKFKNRFKNTCTSIVDTQSGMMGKITDSMGNWLIDNEKNIEKWVDNAGKAIVKVYDNVKNIVDYLIEHKKTIENFALAFASFYVAAKAVIFLTAAMKALKLMILITDGVMKLTTFGKAILIIGAVTTAVVLLWNNWDLVCSSIQKASDATREFLGLSVPYRDYTPPKYVTMKEKNASKNPIAAYGYTTPIKKAVTQKAVTSKLLDKYKLNARGGIATSPEIFGEAGAEIAIPLKNNSRSKSLLSQADNIINGGKSGNTFVINFNGNVGDDAFFDRAGNRIVGQIKLALNNMQEWLV